MIFSINEEHWVDEGSSQDILSNALKDSPIDLEEYKTVGQVGNIENRFVSSRYGILKDIDRIEELLSENCDLKVDFPLSYELIRDEEFSRIRKRIESRFENGFIPVPKNIWRKELFLRYTIEESINLLFEKDEVYDIEIEDREIYGSISHDMGFRLTLEHDVGRYISRLIDCEEDPNFSINFPFRLNITECIVYS